MPPATASVESHQQLGWSAEVVEQLGWALQNLEAAASDLNDAYCAARSPFDGLIEPAVIDVEDALDKLRELVPSED
jgi:hypothetical protein